MKKVMTKNQTSLLLKSDIEVAEEHLWKSYVGKICSHLCRVNYNPGRISDANTEACFNFKLV